jgi:2-polyprenyl-3-methyl-5-hydroxy-6-metoxy-1,4-benzoquinol methylase
MVGDARADATNEDVRRIWEENATFWDATIGAEGNDFHRLLVAPAQMRLLALRPGERVLEIACGNGQFAREMAGAGARVLATDFAQTFLDIARKRGEEAGVRGIEYRRADATDEQELLSLGEAGWFDAMVCTMAAHDIADIAPMMRAARTLLRPDGRFVFSLVHPCFNNARAVFVAETADRDGELTTTHFVKLSQYLRPTPMRATGIVGQPAAHWYFDRPLGELLRPCFEAGLVVDGLEEPAYPPGADAAARSLSWRNYPDIPPALVVRLRPR